MHQVKLVSPRVAAALIVYTVGSAFVGWTLHEVRLDAARSAASAEQASRAVERSARASVGAAELAVSCESQARAELDAAHARIYALEVSLRVVAATSPCRVRLPAPIEDAPRPLWCEDRTSWWAEQLPTLGLGCYPPEAREAGWLKH